MDKNLRAYLFDLYYNGKGITHTEMSKHLERKEGKACYTSGRKIEYNDIIIEASVIVDFNKNNVAFQIICLHVDEIDDFCENYSMYMLNMPTDIIKENFIRIICKNVDVEKFKKFHPIEKWDFKKWIKN